MNSLKDKNIIIGVTSSIAAYKVLELIKKLRKAKANVHVIMTDNATKLVDIKDFEKASGNAVSIELFNKNVDYAGYIKKDKPTKPWETLSIKIHTSQFTRISKINPKEMNVKINKGIKEILFKPWISLSKPDEVFSVMS